MRPTILILTILLGNTFFAQNSLSGETLIAISKLQTIEEQLNNISLDNFYEDHQELLKQYVENLEDEPVTYTVKFAEDVKIFVDNNGGKLNIINPNQKEILKLRIYDLKGSVVMEDNGLTPNERYEYNLPSMNKGIYVASLKLAGNERLNKKLIVNKVR